MVHRTRNGCAPRECQVYDVFVRSESLGSGNNCNSVLIVAATAIANERCSCPTPRSHSQPRGFPSKKHGISLRCSKGGYSILLSGGCSATGPKKKVNGLSFSTQTRSSAYSPELYWYIGELLPTIKIMVVALVRATTKK